VEVELRQVTKRFGDTVALADVSFTVPAGQFVTLLGPSGCGKTTFLRVVAGFEKPDRGDAVLGGEVITHLPPNQRQIGMVFQNYALFPHMTVERNVSFGLRMRHAPAAETARHTAELLDLVGLRDLAGRYPHQLSGGQQQRVALARALEIQPRVLLLDEPFGALDRKLRLQMQVDVKKLIRRLGITTIFVTHDQEEALAMSDLVAVMKSGRIVQSGTPIEIYDNPRDPFVADFVGGSNFLEGDVVGSDDSQITLRLGGALLTVARASEVRPGKRAVLVVRPENLRLAEGDGGGGLTGTISFVRPVGPMMEYEVETDGGLRLKITAPRSGITAAHKLGDVVSVTLTHAENCTVFAL
jgi:putative spermidine/putrescine transport system ATP-binding protein